MSATIPMWVEVEKPITFWVRVSAVTKDEALEEAKKNLRCDEKLTGKVSETAYQISEL